MWRNDATCPLNKCFFVSLGQRQRFRVWRWDVLIIPPFDLFHSSCLNFLRYEETRKQRCKTGIIGNMRWLEEKQTLSLKQTVSDKIWVVMDMFLHKKVNYAWRRDKTVAIAPTDTHDLKTADDDVIWQTEQQICKDNKCTNTGVSRALSEVWRSDSSRDFWTSRDCERQSVGGVASFFFPTFVFGSSSLLCLWSDLGEMNSDGFLGALGLLRILCNWISTVTAPLMWKIKAWANQQSRRRSLAEI